ncbi:hypothetical protein AC249_AIPGENE6935 [Exaiptasia diaphana]|nr:hypothetical protein AC249_AIPGENE6935 [Exaiptasia diaphana]
MYFLLRLSAFAMFLLNVADYSSCHSAYPPNYDREKGLLFDFYPAQKLTLPKGAMKKTKIHVKKNPVVMAASAFCRRTGSILTANATRDLAERTAKKFTEIGLPGNHGKGVHSRVPDAANHDQERVQVLCQPKVVTIALETTKKQENAIQANVHVSILDILLIFKDQ